MIPQNATPSTRAGRMLDSLRQARPLVQNVTNLVAMDMSANTLLALGAAPAMVHAVEEAGEFAAKADALVINIGTLSRPFLDGAEAAATAAHMRGVPWVLDPVGVGATRARDEAAKRLLRHRPSVIRANASEILALAKAVGLSDHGGSGRGVDAQDASESASGAAKRLARHGFCVVAATGAIDIVTDGEQIVRLANGAPLMARVTATGCALSAATAAFCAIAENAFEATLAALAVFGVAGEMAAERATRPGSFRVAFIDALDALDPLDIETRLRIV